MSDAASALRLEDALCLRIGRVARAHVSLDNVLRNLHSVLLSPTQGVYLTENITSTDRLVDDCRMMIKHAPIPAQAVEAGLAALAEAKKVNTERNRVVHDMWLSGPIDGVDDPSVWERTRVDKRLTGAEAPARQQLADVDRVRYDLETVTIRISGLMKVMFFVLPTVSRGMSPDRAAYWVAVAAGKFDRHDDGQVHVHGFAGPLRTDLSSLAGDAED